MYLIKLGCFRTKTAFPCADICILFGKLGYWRTPFPIRVEFFHQNNYGNKGSVTHQDHMDKLNATAPYTLQSRILKYMRSNTKYNSATIGPCSTSAITFDQKYLEKKLNDGSQMESLSKLLLNVNLYLTKLPSRVFLTLLNKVDDRCCMELDKMTRSNILKTLDAWMYVVPHRLTSLKFYCLVLNKMKLWLSDNKSNLTQEEFLQMLFYIGLLKKTSRNSDVLRLCIIYIEDFLSIQTISILEMCMLANAIFKTSTKISSPKILITISNTVENHLDLFLSDPALLVTLIKPLRHAEFYEPRLLKTIESTIIADYKILDSVNFVAKVHILALFAGAMYSEFKIINYIVQSALVDLNTILCNPPTEKNVYLSDRPRNKDLSRLLWSISSLNFDVDKSAVQDIIIPQLSNRLKRNEFVNEPEEIIDCLLSLWMLGHKPCDLILKSLSSHHLTILRKKNKRRFNSRLALLLTCLDIEAPEVLGGQNISPQYNQAMFTEPSITRQLEKRPLLKKVNLVVSIMAQNYGFSKITCNFAIPHLHVAGLTVTTPSGLLNIEVLDDSVCLHNSEKLQGLMQLKLRLLRKFDNHLVVINGREIEKFTEMTDLHIYLENELRKVSRIFWK